MRLPFISALLLVSSLASAQTSYFEDFNSGIAHGWLSDQGTWTVENGYYHGVGHLVNGRVLNVSYVNTFGGDNISVEAVMHSDAGFDDVSKMLVCRYQDPNNFMWVNFVASDRRYMILEQVVNGVRTMLIPENSVFIAPHGQTEWHLCRYDIDGTRVVAYFDNIEVYNHDVTGVLARPGAVGVCTYETQGGGAEEVFVDNFRSSLFDYIPSTSFSLNRGIVLDGGTASLAENDSNYLRVRPGVVLSSSEAPVQIILEGTTPFRDAAEFRFKLEAAVSSTNLRQTTDLFNFQTNQWEQVDTRSASLSDSRIDLVFTNARFIDTATGTVRARVHFKAIGPIISYPWVARLDYAAWTVYTN